MQPFNFSKEDNCHNDNADKACASMKGSATDFWSDKTASDKRCNLRFPSNFSSPLRTISEDEPLKNTNFGMSTPSKSYSVPSNPFDVEVDSLQTSSFSPSVFATSTKREEESASFRWSIEQLALLEPADIDETSQQDTGIDIEKEVKAQKAIDAFFSKNHIVPSPWAPSVKKISFSPHLASTAYPLSKDFHRSSSEVDAHGDSSSTAKEVSTQTMLSIPPNLDLMTLLGHFYTYHEKTEGYSPNSSSGSDVDVLSTSSLRRKLFMNADDSFSSLLSNERNANCASKYATPVAKKNQCVATPSSDHFSSSPITPRNFSLSLNYPRSPLSSPNISPIRASDRSAGSDESVLEDSPDSRDANVEQFHQTVAMNSIYEGENAVSCNTSSCDFFIQDNAPRPEDRGERESNFRDTGYMTGSLSSAASMVSQQTSVSMQFRTTPVIELMEEFAIAKETNVPDNNIDCLKSSFGPDESLMVTSQSELHKTGSAHKDGHSMPWHPSIFSTPTKNSCAKYY